MRFVGTNWTTPVISYLPVTRMETWEFDLNDFIADAVAQGVITDDMYLQSIQAGFELISGGAGLAVNEFYAVIEQDPFPVK